MHHRGERRLLPAGWADAGANAWAMLRAVARQPGGAGKREAIRLAVGLKKSEIRRVDPADLAALVSGMPWLDAGEMITPLRTHFRMGFRRYYWSAPKFEDGTCLGYALADEFFEEALTGSAAEADHAARCLVATLARPRKGLSRQPVSSREEAVHGAGRLAKLPPEWLLQALLYWASTRGAIDELYGDRLFRGHPLDTAPAAPIVSFGWWSTYMDVAESGTFGNVDQVYAAPFHDVCAWLSRKEDIRRAQLVEMENMKNRPTR